MEHRRSDRRYDRRVPIDFAHEGSSFSAHTRNISLGGVFIETDQTLPFGAKKAVTTALAAVVYWPLSRGAKILERVGVNVSNVPLSSYRSRSFYSLRTDALDRIGTRLEQRFSNSDIRRMMEGAGLERIEFSPNEPFWIACGRRAAEIPPSAE